MPTIRVPQMVSRFYTLDWQFATRVGHLSLLRSAALVISAMPIVIELSRGAFGVSWPIPLSLRLTWISSVVYLGCWLVLYLRCPKFIKQYRDYGEFVQKQHSHRWILWEFYNNRQLITSLPRLISEALQKGVAVRAEKIDEPTVYACCPVYPKDAFITAHGIYPPVNVNRDLIVPVVLDRERIVLALQETDPNLAQKEKELFWILLTQLTKERPKSRILFWILAHIAGLGFITSVLWNAGRAVCRM